MYRKKIRGGVLFEFSKKYPWRSKNPLSLLDVQWNTFLQWLTFNVWTLAKHKPSLWKPYRFAKKPSTVNFPSVRLGNGFLKAGHSRPPERMEEKVQSCCCDPQICFKQILNFETINYSHYSLNSDKAKESSCLLMARFNQVDVSQIDRWWLVPTKNQLLDWEMRRIGSKKSEKTVYLSPKNASERTRARTMSRMDGCIILMFMLIVIDNKSWLREPQVHGLNFWPTHFI